MQPPTDSLFASTGNQTVKRNSISIGWDSARVNVIGVTLRGVTLQLTARMMIIFRRRGSRAGTAITTPETIARELRRRAE